VLLQSSVGEQRGGGREDEVSDDHRLAPRAISDDPAQTSELTYTSMEVTEIACLLGYGDPAYLARVFAKATASCPPPSTPA
jgi:AraC-like DNA-binding protein